MRCSQDAGSGGGILLPMGLPQVSEARRPVGTGVGVLARFPHAARAGGLLAVALVVGAIFNAANPQGLRWRPSPDGRIGIPRVFESRLPQISAAQALALLKSGGAIFVDSRDTKDYQADHIPGAISLPMREWNQAWPKMRARLPRDAVLVLYCYGGECGLSTRMGKRLLELGYRRLLVLRRGFAEWTEAGYPTVRKSATRPADKAS
jgi:rhodanese-related sulfurtransferase